MVLFSFDGRPTGHGPTLRAAGVAIGTVAGTDHLPVHRRLSAAFGRRPPRSNGYRVANVDRTAPDVRRGRAAVRRAQPDESLSRRVCDRLQAATQGPRMAH